MQGDNNDLQERLLRLIPEDGSTVSNAELRERLGLDEASYLSVRDELIDQKKIERWKGRGGTVRRAIQSEPLGPVGDSESAVEAAVDAASWQVAEAALYEPMAKVIGGTRANRLGQELIGVSITARAGRKPTGGYWTRPDIVAVETRSPKFVPGKFLNVITFEVKPTALVDIRAVYEALAHLRSATHSWVVFHIPDANRTAMQTTIAEVQQEASSHGIGVIVAGDPADYDTWEELEDAQRREPDPDRLDNFIEVQLDQKLQDQILRWR